MQQAGMGQSHRNELVKWPRCTQTHTRTRIQSYAQLERQSQSPSLQYILAVYRRIIISRLLTPSISLSLFLCIRGSRWRCAAAATRRGGTWDAGMSRHAHAHSNAHAHPLRCCRRCRLQQWRVEAAVATGICHTGGTCQEPAVHGRRLAFHNDRAAVLQMKWIVLVDILAEQAATKEWKKLRCISEESLEGWFSTSMVSNVHIVPTMEQATSR